MLVIIRRIEGSWRVSSPLSGFKGGSNGPPELWSRGPSAVLPIHLVPFKPQRPFPYQPGATRRVPQPARDPDYRPGDLDPGKFSFSSVASLVILASPRT